MTKDKDNNISIIKEEIKHIIDNIKSNPSRYPELKARIVEIERDNPNNDEIQQLIKSANQAIESAIKAESVKNIGNKDIDSLTKEEIENRQKLNDLLVEYNKDEKVGKLNNHINKISNDTKLNQQEQKEFIELADDDELHKKRHPVLHNLIHARDLEEKKPKEKQDTNYLNYLNNEIDTHFKSHVAHRVVKHGKLAGKKDHEIVKDTHNEIKELKNKNKVTKEDLEKEHKLIEEARARKGVIIDNKEAIALSEQAAQEINNKPILEADLPRDAKTDFNKKESPVKESAAEVRKRLKREQDLSNSVERMKETLEAASSNNIYNPKLEENKISTNNEISKNNKEEPKSVKSSANKKIDPKSELGKIVDVLHDSFHKEGNTIPTPSTNNNKSKGRSL